MSKLIYPKIGHKVKPGDKVASLRGALTLPEVLARVVEFSRNDYFNGTRTVDYPDDVACNAAFVCACFIAQCTKNGHDGVDMETPYAALAMDKDMPYKARVALAAALVADFGGCK